MSQNVEPPDGPPFHDLALELFGEGEWSRGGRLGDVFADFMRRHGNRLWTDHLLYGSRDFVFDDCLPEPGVVPAQIYESEKDRGEMFLTELQEGVETGLVFDAETILDGGHPALLGLSDAMVMAQKDIDAGRRDGWQPGGRLELRHQAWLRGGYIFMLDTDDRGRLIHFPDDARPIAFKTAWEFLESVGSFKGLLGLVAITMASRVPRDGTADPSLLPSGIWDDELMRLDFGRNILFVPTYDDAKPWVARFEDIHLLNRALHPEWEPVHEITEVGHGIGESPPGLAARSGAEPPRYVGNWRQKVEQACDELRRRGIAVGTATVYDELRGTGLDPNRDTVRRYVSDYMETFEPN